MRHPSHILAIALAATLLAGCRSDDLTADIPGAEQTREGMMPVHLTFSLAEATAVTRASIVTGKEESVSDIKMLCFNQFGNFLGMYSATKVERASATDPDIGFIDGEVDANTCSIHFIANCEDLVVSQASNYLRDEASLIKDKALTIDYHSEHVTYWGYHKEPNADAMKTFLAPAVGNNNKIYLLRDRVKVIAEPIAADVITKNKIEKIEWTVSNGLTKGYLIPWKTTLPDKELTGSTPVSITPYDKSDAARYGFDELGGLDEDAVFEAFDAAHPQFMFEDLNESTGNFVKLIFRVKYTDESGYKYHVIRMMDAENRPFNLTRNHIYRVKIKLLHNIKNTETTFEDALKSTAYSNDAFASVAELVDEVTDGDAVLVIKGKTTQEITKADVNGQNEYTFGFTYYSKSDQASITKDNFQIDGLSGWDDFAEVTGWTYNSSTREGTVTIKLKHEINATLRTGGLRIYDKHDGLYRNVHFYAITEFTYPKEPTVAYTATHDVTTKQGGGAHAVYNDIYDLSFDIPGDYPAGLYPITIVIGSSTLRPYSDTVIDRESGDFSIAVESTGSDGWDFASSNTARTWNYHANTWNYVYKYIILEKPVYPDDHLKAGEYVEEDITHHIFFVDKRASFGTDNRPTNVGLYFEVENFGKSSRRQVYGLNNSMTVAADS